MGKACLIVALLTAFGCGAGGKPSFETAAIATIQSADLAYGLSVEVCDAKEQTIIARACPADTTAEECEARDRQDIQKVRHICDQIFGAFEGVRKAAPAVKMLNALEL